MYPPEAMVPARLASSSGQVRVAGGENSGEISMSQEPPGLASGEGEVERESGL